jgi:hypothetical protein
VRRIGITRAPIGIVVCCANAKAIGGFDYRLRNFPISVRAYRQGTRGAGTCASRRIRAP